MRTRHARPLKFFAAGILIGAIGSGAPSVAQELGTSALNQIQAIYTDKAGWTPAQRKLATSLLYASRESRGLPMVQGLSPLRRIANRAGVDGEGMVVVDIRAEVTDGLLETIVRAGGRVTVALPAYGAVRARVPVRRLEAIAALPEVRYVTPRQGARVNTGSQTSQGDTAHAAALARTTYGIDGTGVKVGVLSDGVDTLAARQGTGDLPPTCPQAGACVQVVAGQAGSGDEGTAMLEIVHDLAPGAKLYFATAFNGDASFAANIQALKNTYGCDIIVDDVTYDNEAAFQDGVIAQAVNAVRASGALFFSSAGNSGRKDAGTSGTWEGDFLSSGTVIAPVSDFEGGNLPIHSFNGLTGGGSANSNALTIDADYAISLKWSDPLGGATNDYDIFLLDAGLTTLWDGSFDDQGITGEPFEIMGPAFAGERVVVVLYGHVVTPGEGAVAGGGAPRALRLDTYRSRLSLSTARAVVGHNAGDGTISVAATDARVPALGSPFVGGATNPVETYSSDGPRRIFYHPNGAAVTPGNLLFGTNGGLDLRKPDITAADCVFATTPGFSPFCGTSAAAPHAAAIAALLKSAANRPGGGQALAAMFTTALDVTPTAGWDQNSGVGIVMANAAAGALTPAAALDLFTVSPCRLFDTRLAAGPTGGAPLTCGVDYAFTVGGACAVPAGAKAVSLNVTVTAPSVQGSLLLYAPGAPAPLVSNLNYLGGLTRANNAVAPLNSAGKLAVRCQQSGTAHVILDVNGYFQ